MSRTRWLDRLKQASYPVGAMLVALGVWETAVRVFAVPRYILPPPSSVISQGILRAAWIGKDFGITFQEAVAGLAAAIVVAIPLGLLLSYSAWLRRSFYPIIVFIDEVPKIAFAPILVTWFGFDWQPKVILTFIVCCFPIFLNSMAGFSSINEDVINLGRSSGAREWEMFWKIRVHSALPQIFVGLKMAASAAMTGAAVAEFLASDRGLGFFLQRALSQLNMALGLATIMSMWVIGLAFFYGMTLIESWAIRWHVSKRTGPQVIL